MALAQSVHQGLLNHFFDKSTYTAETIYVGLSSTQPTSTGGNAPAGPMRGSRPLQATGTAPRLPIRPRPPTPTKSLSPRQPPTGFPGLTLVGRCSTRPHQAERSLGLGPVPRRSRSIPGTRRNSRPARSASPWVRRDEVDDLYAALPRRRASDFRRLEHFIPVSVRRDRGEPFGCLAVRAPGRQRDNYLFQVPRRGNRLFYRLGLA